MRIGFGYDVHKLVRDRKMILGGVEVESELGLLGHSDADALCHAIADALLGSLALGDIGQHFPDTDPQFSGISSLELLKHTARMVAEKSYQIANVDSTIVLERPRLAPYVRAMRKNIGQALALEESQISVKATTNEKLGFLGHNEGLAAYAIVLVKENRYG